MIKIILNTPLISLGLVALVSFTALATAFAAEGLFGIEPCNLCVYQRYPYAIGFILGIAGVILHKNRKVSSVLLCVCGLNFLANSAIASYHTGVEQKWWESIIEGCRVPLSNNDSGQSLLENIMSAPMASCDEIPWQDPILGLSMANINVIFCLGLFVFCITSAIAIKKSQAPS